MTTAAPSTALATIQPAFTDAERIALAGLLAGYRGLPRDAYALDLRQFTSWCRSWSLNLFAVRRADIENFARDLEARGRARARVRVPVSQRGDRVTARRAGRQSHRSWDARSPRRTAPWPMAAATRDTSRTAPPGRSP